MLQDDLSMASTPRKLQKSLHSSISRTLGRKLSAALKDSAPKTDACVPFISSIFFSFLFSLGEDKPRKTKEPVEEENTPRVSLVPYLQVSNERC